MEELTYSELIKAGCTPEEAREVMAMRIRREEAIPEKITLKLKCKLCGKELPISVEEYMKHVEREHYGKFIDVVEREFFERL